MKLQETYDVRKLYFRCNHEDECWELLERDGVPETEDEPGDDALLAKFYDGDVEGSLLAEFVSEKLNEARQKLYPD
jgi:hypothetical protein